MICNSPYFNEVHPSPAELATLLPAPALTQSDLFNFFHFFQLSFFQGQEIYDLTLWATLEVMKSLDHRMSRHHRDESMTVTSIYGQRFGWMELIPKIV
jgi:hypothetical protein